MCEDVLHEKELLKKAATIKEFEYSPLGSELKKQTDIVKDHYKLFKDHINSKTKKERKKKNKKTKKQELK